MFLQSNEYIHFYNLTNTYIFILSNVKYISNYNKYCFCQLSNMFGISDE